MTHALQEQLQECERLRPQQLSRDNVANCMQAAPTTSLEVGGFLGGGALMPQRTQVAKRSHTKYYCVYTQTDNIAHIRTCIHAHIYTRTYTETTTTDNNDNDNEGTTTSTTSALYTVLYFQLGIASLESAQCNGRSSTHRMKQRY